MMFYVAIALVALILGGFLFLGAQVFKAREGQHEAEAKVAGAGLSEKRALANLELAKDRIRRLEAANKAALQEIHDLRTELVKRETPNEALGRLGRRE